MRRLILLFFFFWVWEKVPGFNASLRVSKPWNLFLRERLGIWGQPLNIFKSACDLKGQKGINIMGFGVLAFLNSSDFKHTKNHYGLIVQRMSCLLMMRTPEQGRVVGTQSNNRNKMFAHMIYRFTEILKTS